MCVPKDKMCDGVVDCDNGADEKGCCKFLLPRNSDLKCVSTWLVYLSLLCIVRNTFKSTLRICPSIPTVSLAPHMDFTSYVHQYYKSGYLVYQEGEENMRSLERI